MKDVTRLAKASNTSLYAFSNGIALIEQRKLDEMNNHIAELHTIIEDNFEKLPYEVQRRIRGYF